MTKQMTPEDMMNKWMRVINKFTLIENSPRDFGSGDRLYPSEIHTIEAIGQNQGINVTQLAETMGVTKAAISQIVRRLEKKEFVQRYKGLDNQKEVLLRLMKKGRVSFEGHKKFHAVMDVDIIKRIKKMTPVEYGFFDRVLSELDAYSGRILEERK
jgi:DNA-binding MarR family transcriptional regulator